MREIIERIQQVQGARSLSAFARDCGIPPMTLTHLVKGERKPSVEVVVAICRAYRVSADWLLGLSEESAGVERSITAPIIKSNNNNNHMSCCADCKTVQSLTAVIAALTQAKGGRS